MIKKMVNIIVSNWKSRLRFMIFFSIILFLSLSFASAELSLRITARLNFFSSDFVTLTDAQAASGYDQYDFIAPKAPGQYSTFGSYVSGHTLAVDVWNPSIETRVFNLTFATYPNSESGPMNLTWKFEGENYDALLVDYGDDGSFRTPASSNINLASQTGYNVDSVTGVRYMQLTIIYHDFVRSSGSTGGGGGGGGGILNGSLDCSKEKCGEWGTCTNLEETYKYHLMNDMDYIGFKKMCTLAGFGEKICGYQKRDCNITISCNNTVYLPKESQVCQYVENPSCLDGVMNCHDGKCEERIDCGGPCSSCPTCSDGQKNQGEKDIDCGGPCLRKCPDTQIEKSLKGALPGIIQFAVDNWFVITSVAIITLIVLVGIVIWMVLGRKKSVGLSDYTLEG